MSVDITGTRGPPIRLGVTNALTASVNTRTDPDTRPGSPNGKGTCAERRDAKPHQHGAEQDRQIERVGPEYQILTDLPGVEDARPGLIAAKADREQHQQRADHEQDKPEQVRREQQGGAAARLLSLPQ